MGPRGALEMMLIYMWSIRRIRRAIICLPSSMAEAGARWIGLRMGEAFWLSKSISAEESYLWTVDASSGAKTLITPKGGAVKIAYDSGRFSKDGKGIYVTTDKDSEFQRLTYVDLSDQAAYLSQQRHSVGCGRV